MTLDDIGNSKWIDMTLDDIGNSKCTEFVCQYINKSGNIDYIILSKEQILNHEWAQFYFNGGYKR